MTRTQDPFMTSWTVYKYKCPNEDCELLNPSYIGQTRNTIKTRLQQHCRDGAIKEHMERKHNTGQNTEILENNTKPVKNFSKLNKLIIYEALLIIEERPDINRQIDNFTNPLKLYSRSLMLITTIHQHHKQHKLNTNIILDRKQEICEYVK